MAGESIDAASFRVARPQARRCWCPFASIRPRRRSRAEGDSPYGAPGEPNDIGIMVPAGFSVREVARHGVEVGRRGYSWHRRPDGGATFPTDDEGWVYTSNSEVNDEGKGGVGALRFNRDGELVDAYSICRGHDQQLRRGPHALGHMADV